MVHLTDTRGISLCGQEGPTTRRPRRCTCHECLDVLHRARRDRVLAEKAREEIDRILAARKKKQEARVLRYNHLHEKRK